MKRFILVFLMMLCTIVLYSGSAFAISMDEFKLNGFFDLEYEESYKVSSSMKDSSSVDRKGSFDQYHFNILMEFPMSDNVTVKGHIEYEHVPQLSGKKIQIDEAGNKKVDVDTGKGEIKIEWAYLEYLLTNSIRLRGGMALTPFGIYNEIHDATPTYLSIRTPWGIYKTTSVGSLNNHAMFPKFSTGIFALGNYLSDSDLRVNYVFYISNGENFSKNEAERDDNDNKALGGRVMVSPISGLTVGGSFFTGKKQTSATDMENHTAWAGSLDYTIHNIGLRAEYASSKLADITQKGSYGEVSYRVLRQMTPYLRYGMFDPDDEGDEDEWSELVYGINYELQPHFIIKIENRHFKGDTNNAKVSDDYNELGAAVTVAF